jgi:hypothetical protein
MIMRLESFVGAVRGLIVASRSADSGFVGHI